MEKLFSSCVSLLGGIPQCSRMYWMKNLIRASSWSDPASRACYGSFPNLDDLLRRAGEPWVSPGRNASHDCKPRNSATGRSLAWYREGLVSTFAPKAEAWGRLASGWSCSWTQKWSFTDRPGKSQGVLRGGLSFPGTTVPVGLRLAFLMSKWLLS